MKKSELRQIIKEEIEKAIDPIQAAFSKKLGSQSPSYSNKEFFYIENLPITDKGIYLPSIDKPDASDLIRSKERAREWERDFITKFGLDKDDRVRIVKKDEKFIPINSSKFDSFRKGTDSIMSFYDKLKYKGD
jgi:hypothetical protein